MDQTQSLSRLDFSHWALARLGAQEVLREVWDGKLDELKARPIQDLWAAEAIWTRQEPRVSSAMLALGWAGLCIDAGAGAVLSWILDHPAYLSPRCQDGKQREELMAEVARQSVQAKSLSCLEAVCSKSPEAAWLCARMSCPGGGADSSAREPWFAGYERSVAMSLKWGAPDGEAAAKQCSMAMFSALAGQWKDKQEAVDGFDIALGALEALEVGGGASRDLLSALARRAASPGPIQERAWTACKSMASALGMDWSQGLPLSIFGLSASEPMSPSHRSRELSPVGIFGDLIDPAWVAASKVVDLVGVAQVRRMAKDMRGSGSAATRPLMAPSLSGMRHPLEKAWDVWEHSLRAGFALPKKPLMAAKIHFEDAMRQWEASLPGDEVEQWRSQGKALFDSLFSGKVPDRFPGHGSKPSLDASRESYCEVLTPLAWAWSRSERDGFTHRKAEPMAEAQMLAVALAQDALGYGLDAASRQCFSATGAGLDTKWIASAQRQILALASADGVEAKANRLRI